MGEKTTANTKVIFAFRFIIIIKAIIDQYGKTGDGKHKPNKEGETYRQSD